VVVIVHEAVGVTEPIVPFDNRTYDSKKTLPVLVVAEYIIPGIASGGYMVDCTWVFDSYRSRHENKYNIELLIFQDLTPERPVPGSATSISIIHYIFSGITFQLLPLEDLDIPSLT
jgi:hypothetical protein